MYSFMLQTFSEHLLFVKQSVNKSFPEVVLEVFERILYTEILYHFSTICMKNIKTKLKYLSYFKLDT